MIFCNELNKTSTSVELLAMNILRYMAKGSNIGLRIKSVAGLKPSWKSGIVHPLKFDELLQ